MSAGAPPQTLLGKLTALPRPLVALRGLLLGEGGRGRKMQGDKGRERDGSFPRLF